MILYLYKIKRNKNMNEFRLTIWDEELGSYILSNPEKYNSLDERDLINYIGSLEDNRKRLWEDIEFIAETWSKKNAINR